MFNSSLSLDQAPPLKIPLRFFITSPIFGILAGLFIVGFVPSLASRSSLEVVVLTHFLTIGFLAMSMVGAMFQMLPVTAGVKFKHQNVIAPTVHILLSAGVLLFAYSFYKYQLTLMSIAMSLLLLAFTVFIIATLTTLKSAKSVTPTIKAFIGALVSLIVAMLLAGYLVLSHANTDFSQHHQAILYTHIIFSLLGWIGLLIIGVSYQVIPMFYVADSYPELYTKYAVKVMLVLLVSLGFSLFINNAALYLLLKILVGLILADYAITTITLLLNRKRKITDTTTYYWYFSMLMLLSAIGLSLADEWFNTPLLNTLSVLMFIYGFAVSVMSGMLFKIVPFLVWFHLTNEGYMNMPTMNDLIGKKLTTLQFVLHVASLLLLIGLVLDSSFQIPAGVALVLSNSVLVYNLIKGSRIYFSKQSLEKMSF